MTVIGIKFSKLFYFVFGFTLLMFASAGDLSAENKHMIRVNLSSKGFESFDLMISGRFECRDGNSGKLLWKDTDLPLTGVKGGETGIWLGSKSFVTNYLEIRLRPDETFSVNNKKYRGDIAIYVVSKNKILVVNHIGLEDYIKGVLIGEMPKRWPENALRAQAIASRTYALYQKGIHQDKLYDLTADIYSQVYGGFGNETWISNRIVKETKGVVLVYKNTLIPAFFHSTCGGKTEYGNMVWKKIDVPCLKSVTCHFCSDAPNYDWMFNLKLEDLQNKIKDIFNDSSEIVISVDVKNKTSSGRVKQLNITTSQGQYVMDAVDFRLRVSPRMIKSTRFDLSTHRDQLVFHGQGWGHGVGFCQWGAKGLAEKKLKTDEILLFYYSGSKLVKLQ
ncbi:SpoIID/LytB domain-containing protein [PVC group bacterium]|nr:SpoIID/LytB domain-containing protein [PVC group bacterium]